MTDTQSSEEHQPPILHSDTMSSLFNHTANYLRVLLPKPAATKRKTGMGGQTQNVGLDASQTQQTIAGQGAARAVLETSWNIDPQQASALLVSLPVEMLNVIVSYLTSESEVAFALTCRLLYRLYMPPEPRLMCLEDEQKRDLLLWLERDTPQLCFCHACLKLHTWSRVPRVVDRDIYYPQLCPKQLDDPLLWMPHPSYGIRYGHARLIMRRHLYGDSYGLELETLNRDRLVEARISYPPTGVGVMAKQSWRARIINDELYVKATMEIYHRKGCARTFGQCLYNPIFEFEQSRVCYHVWACHDPYWKVSASGYSVQEVHRDEGLPDMIFTRTQGPLKSCPHCFTDFRISTKYIPPFLNANQQEDGPAGWVMTISKWHRLGKCRCPEDREWASSVSFMPHQLGHVRTQDASCSAGEVYRAWEGAELNRDGAAGIVSESEDCGDKEASFVNYSQERCQCRIEYPWGTLVRCVIRDGRYVPVD